MLLTLAAVGVMYAMPLVQMVESPALVQAVEGRLEGRSGNRLGKSNQRFTRNHRRHSGCRGLAESTDAIQTVETDWTFDAIEADYSNQPLRQHCANGLCGQSYPGTDSDNGEVNAGWIDPKTVAKAGEEVDECDCEDCNCPHPLICKNGDCQKNYAIMFTAWWCPACPPSKKAMDELHKAGYIVYFVDYDEYKKEFGKERLKELGVFALPTVLVYDKGKIVKRVHKPSDIRLLKNSMKTEAEQKEEEKPDPDYILRDSNDGTHKHIRGRSRNREAGLRR